MTGPSVIRIGIELRGEALAKLLFSVLQICKDDLRHGEWRDSALVKWTQMSIANCIVFLELAGVIDKL